VKYRTAVVVGVLLLASAAGCSSSGGGSTAKSSATTKETTTTSASSERAGAGTGIVNQWTGSPADRTRLPIGTAHVSTTTPAVGNLFACDAGQANDPGAFAVGPWIDEAAGTWDATQKVAVAGQVSWPMAQYHESVTGATRTITGNGLPVGNVTGTFPIAATDPAYSYDRNPNSIGESAVSKTLPVTPTAASAPSCLPKGAIGVLENGVVLYAPIDERNRDAVAYETQDQCDGHPQQSSTYHYHDIPSCIRDATTGTSTVVGFAYDGYPIVVERDAAGHLPTNTDLDQCHGRTSPITLDGTTTTMYHYSATYEFPYTVGCFHGTAM